MYVELSTIVDVTNDRCQLDRMVQRAKERSCCGHKGDDEVRVNKMRQHDYRHLLLVETIIVEVVPVLVVKVRVSAMVTMAGMMMQQGWRMGVRLRMEASDDEDCQLYSSFQGVHAALQHHALVYCPPFTNDPILSFGSIIHHSSLSVERCIYCHSSKSICPLHKTSK